MPHFASATEVHLANAFLRETGIPQRNPKGKRLPDGGRPWTGAVVPATQVFELLNYGAEQAGQEDFGLRYGRWLNLRGIDTISLMWRHAESVAQWYELAGRFVTLENDALSYDVLRSAHRTRLIHGVAPPLDQQSTHVIQATITLTTRVFRETLDPHWSPLRLELRQAPPRDPSPFEDFFAAPVRFSQKENVLVVRTEDFLRKNPGHDTELMAFLVAYQKAQAASRALGLQARVSQAISRELSLRPVSLKNIAETLVTTPRSLQRHLRARGCTFSELLREARIQTLKTHRASEGPLPLKRLARELGFSDASATSRFLRSLREGEE